jgi:hypothetical protein
MHYTNRSMEKQSRRPIGQDSSRSGIDFARAYDVLIAAYVRAYVRANDRRSNQAASCEKGQGVMRKGAIGTSKSGQLNQFNRTDTDHVWVSAAWVGSGLHRGTTMHGKSAVQVPSRGHGIATLPVNWHWRDLHLNPPDVGCLGKMEIASQRVAEGTFS